jgi:hypothetical protein
LRETLKQLGVGPAVRAAMATGVAAARSARAAQKAQERLRARYAVPDVTLESSAPPRAATESPRTTSPGGALPTSTETQVIASGARRASSSRGRSPGKASPRG